MNDINSYNKTGLERFPYLLTENISFKHKSVYSKAQYTFLPIEFVSQTVRSRFYKFLKIQ